MLIILIYQSVLCFPLKVLLLHISAVAVAQEVQRVIQKSEGWWFDPRFLQSTYPCACLVPQQDIVPQIAPDGCSIGV